MHLQEIFGITPTEAENSYQYYKNSLSDAVAGLAGLQENGSASLEEAIAKSPHSSESTGGMLFKNSQSFKIWGCISLAMLYEG